MTMDGDGLAVRRAMNLDMMCDSSRLQVLYTGAVLLAPYCTAVKWQLAGGFLDEMGDRLVAAGMWRSAVLDLDLRQASSSGTSEERLIGCLDTRLGCMVWLRLDKGVLRVNVGGPSRPVVEAVIAILRERFPAVDPQETGAVWMDFWYYGPRGPYRVKRRIAVPPWADVAANYMPEARRLVAGVLGWDRPEATGRLLLWHGPPGTGKTYAIRSLVWAWRAWCSFHYIADPDQFFGEHADYLMKVLLDEDGGDDAPDEGNGKPKAPLWRLLILEDAGEFLTVDARQRSGQGFARFLNTVDGLLGQGLRLLLLISSNEDLGKLHPAVTRPGRCTSRIEFQPFSQAEAQAWLVAHGDVAAGAGTSTTLAELYAQVAGRRTDDKALAAGFTPAGAA